MTSLINPTNIDITYPIAGQDNDTQGFRTNFTNIKNNLIQAATEITALQNTVATLNTETFGNANVAAYVSTYTGNISAGNVITPSTTINNGITSTGNISTTGNIFAKTLTLTSVIQFANLTTTQVNSITGPQRGMTVYNYTTGNIQVYNGTKWANITLS